MLEVFDQNPASRVFHVDEECYILYLGAHWDDYKPFLRLGTSGNLPAKLPPIVSTIVVPDILTGSPLEEEASLSGDATGDTHYVGDVRTINKLKSFVGIESIAVEGLKRASRETDDNDNVYVYSYKDGNLKIKYHKNEIFDLRRRERQDLHYPARAQALKNEFGRSPFRFLVDAYQRPGFVVASGQPYVISHGELAAPVLRDNYFAELAAAGVDPDRVSAVRVERVNPALVRYFKRCRAKEKVPRVSTSDKDTAKALAGIFRANSLPPLKITLLEGDGETFVFHRIQIAVHSGWSKVTFGELDGPVVFGSPPSSTAAAMVVNHDAGTLTLGSRKLALIEGCIHQFDDSPMSRTEIRDRYLPEKNYPFRDMLSADENSIIDQSTYFFSELFAGRDPGKVLKTIKAIPTVRDLGRGARPNPILSVVLANFVEFSRFVGASEQTLEKATSQLGEVLGRKALQPAEVPSSLPLVADIRYHEDTPYLFYRFTSRITSDRMAHTASVVEKIAAVPHIDFESERMRLAELVDGLADPEQMEEARLRKIAERKKPVAEVKPPPTAAPEKEALASAAATSTSAGSASGRSRSRRSRGGGGPWRWLLPLIVLLLLLGLFGLLFTGTIPNRWFGDRGDSGETQGTSDETGSSGDDGIGDSTDGTAESSVQGDGQTTAGADGEDGQATGDAADSTSGQSGDQAVSDSGDTSSGADGTGTDAGSDGEGSGTTADSTDSGTGPDGASDPDVPPEFRGRDNVLDALDQMDDVIITAERVIGPGGIEITLLDIIALVNRIATDNGYKPMDSADPDLPDPDWIYPENVFVLPDATRYTVVEGDTLWVITVRYMVERLADDYNRYASLTEEFERDATSENRRDQIASELQTIGEASHTENFTKLVEEKLVEWRD